MNVPTQPAASTIKLNPAMFAEPIPVIIRRDTAGNLGAFLKNTLKTNPDNPDEGTIGVWFASRGNEISELPLAYYNSTRSVSAEDESVFAQKFGKEFGAPFGVALKKRVAKDKAHAHRKAASNNSTVNDVKRNPDERERVSDAVKVLTKEDLQMKLQIALDAIPAAISAAVASAVDSVLKTVFDDNSVAH